MLYLVVGDAGAIGAIWIARIIVGLMIGVGCPPDGESDRVGDALASAMMPISTNVKARRLRALTTAAFTSTFHW